MSSKRRSCIDPEIEKRLIVEAGLMAAQGLTIELPAELARHLDRCASCQDLIKTIKIKADESIRLEDAQQIVRFGRMGSSNIHVKKVPGGTAYYREDGNVPEHGLLVVTKDDSLFDIRRVEETTLQSFENLEAQD